MLKSILGKLLMYVFRNSCSSFFSPLGEVDEEARLAIPVPGACGAVFRRSWEYVGPLGIIFLVSWGSLRGLLGTFLGVLGPSWRLLGRLGTLLGGSWAIWERLWSDLSTKSMLDPFYDRL